MGRGEAREEEEAAYFRQMRDKLVPKRSFRLCDACEDAIKSLPIHTDIKRDSAFLQRLESLHIKVRTSNLICHGIAATTIRNHT